MNNESYGENRSSVCSNPLAIVGAAALILLLPSAARSGGVVPICTEANLRAAMAGGGPVTFACDGTIALASTITNTVNTTLDGNGHNVSISGEDAVRVFLVATNSTFTLKNLKLINGRATKGAGIFNDGGTLTLSGVAMTGNKVDTFAEMVSRFETAEGGALYNQNGVVTIESCTFYSNTAYQGSDDFAASELMARGGAIRNVGGVVNLVNCQFIANRASGGPTIGPVLYSRDGVGGAIHNSGMLTATRCSFVGNAARGEPAASTIYPGFAGGSGMGGAIYNDGSLALVASTVASNSASGGSGGFGSPGCADCPGYPPYPGGVGGSGGSAYGAGLFNSGSAGAVNCTFAWNSCSGGNGGQGGNGGPAHFHGLSGSDGGNGGAGGSSFGGGIHGPALLTNCTLAFNSVFPGAGGAGGQGGNGMPPGISGQPGANGTPGSAGGGGVTGGSLVNTLLATNAPGGNSSGLLTDLSHNLSSDASCSFTNVGSLNNTGPKLGPLADNGGPTLTIALLPGSPAINTGNTTLAPATDQRGLPRPSGADVDIGAYEYVPRLQIARSPQSGRTIRLLDGAPSQWCRLLTSTNLSDWQAVGTNQIGADGTAILQDNSGAEDSPRFYRGAMP